jgi:hypothetical protein
MITTSNMPNSAIPNRAIITAARVVGGIWLGGFA